MFQIFPSDNFLIDSSYYMIYINLLADLSFWLTTLLAVIICLIPDVIFLVLSNQKWKPKPKLNTTVPFVEPKL